MSKAKGLNSTESKNRLRFQTISERLSRVNVDVVHKIRQTGALDEEVPDTGTQGCFFQDELERCKDFDSTSYFKRFYYDMWPLVQSLPELLHNLPVVTAALKDKLKGCPKDSLNSFLQLLSVLGRDIQDDMFDHTIDFFSILTTLLDDVSQCGEKSSKKQADPEMTGKIFECMSHMIRYKRFTAQHVTFIDFVLIACMLINQVSAFSNCT